MRNAVFALLSILALIPLHGPAAADEALDTSAHRFGIGVSLGSEQWMILGNDSPLLMSIPSSLTNFYFPMHFSGKLKIEPEIGFFRYSTSSVRWGT